MDLTPRFTLRVQADYLNTNTFGATQNNIRISTGLVFHHGHIGRHPSFEFIMLHRNLEASKTMFLRFVQLSTCRNFPRRGSMMPSKRTSLILIAMGLATVVGCGSSSPSSSSSTTQPFQNQHLAFVALPTTNSVAAYKVDNNSAIFTNILGSPYPGGTSPSAVLVHPSNRFVYAANQIGNDISLFTVNSTLGSLLEVLPRTPAGLTPLPSQWIAEALFFLPSTDSPAVFRFIPSTQETEL